MAKYRIYAVGYGIDPNTKAPVYGLKVHTWKDCEQYVKGIDGAKFKGFLTDTEADAWIQKVMTDLGVGTAPKPLVTAARVYPTATAAPASTDITTIRSRFVDICNQHGVNPQDMVNRLITNFVDEHDFLNGLSEEEGDEEDEDFNQPLPFN